MKTFNDLVFDQNIYTGVGAKMFFINGYGVSVISGVHTYGGNKGLFELAVLKGTNDNYDLCYDTDITNDVLGYLTENEVSDIMVKVQSLV